MSYLISISIGPVQDFIASARRSRDLWFGSHLLSELSKVVAETIVSQKGELIFPSNLSGNVVNKILAIVENPQAVETSCKNAIEKRLKEIYEMIFNKIERKLPKNEKIFYRTEAEAQINDMVEFYWAAYPFDENDDENNYVECRKRVEILLNARKSTRNFDAVTWASNAPKSSLDGQRESVIKDIRVDDEKIQKVFRLRKKERLCGVGLLKRFGAEGTDDSFFSTSHVASLPLLDLVKDKSIDDFDYIREITKIVGVIEDNSELKNIVGNTPISHDFFKNYDGHLLFEERLNDFFEDDDLDEAKTALKKFMVEAFGRENTKPLPYYALLLADGDRMGTVIDNQENKQDHKDLSEALSDFAANCKPIVEANNGCLVYAGGDDVLAFVPLHTVLDCAKKLADEFKDKLSKNQKFVDEKGKPPTLSVGIAVAHHIEPLQDALATMRNAEKEAKSFDPKNKNALAIILSKRSGADTTIRGSWENDKNTGESFDERLKWFIQLHLDDALPDGVAYELRDLWLRFKDILHLEKPMKADAVRILQRKRSNQGLSKVSKKILDKLEGLILNTDLSLEDLANEIIVARDFAKAYKQAKKQAKGETEL